MKTSVYTYIYIYIHMYIYIYIYGNVPFVHQPDKCALTDAGGFSDLAPARPNPFSDRLRFAPTWHLQKTQSVL